MSLFLCFVRAPFKLALLNWMPLDNFRRVRSHEKNSGETVLLLGTIIQRIFCAQSGAGIRLNFWK